MEGARPTAPPASCTLAVTLACAACAAAGQAEHADAMGPQQAATDARTAAQAAAVRKLCASEFAKLKPKAKAKRTGKRKAELIITNAAYLYDGRKKVEYTYSDADGNGVHERAAVKWLEGYYVAADSLSVEVRSKHPKGSTTIVRKLPQAALAHRLKIKVAGIGKDTELVFKVRARAATSAAGDVRTKTSAPCHARGA